MTTRVPPTLDVHSIFHDYFEHGRGLLHELLCLVT